MYHSFLLQAVIRMVTRVAFAGIHPEYSRAGSGNSRFRFEMRRAPGELATDGASLNSLIRQTRKRASSSFPAEVSILSRGVISRLPRSIPVPVVDYSE